LDRRAGRVESEEVAPGIVPDFDARGNVIGIEVPDVLIRAVGRDPAHHRKRAAGE
jgi:Protein of unknown function (DUF2283)